MHSLKAIKYLIILSFLLIGTKSINSQTYPDTLWIPVTYYDFHADGSNPEFEPDHRGGVRTGLIHDTLDQDNKPISSEIYLNHYIKYWYRDWVDSAQGDSTAPSYNSNGDFVSIQSVNHDTSFKNIVIHDSLPFQHLGAGVYQYWNDEFFPLDGRGFGDPSGHGHNFSFAMELSATFVHRKGLTFNFRGDDDVWAFVNGNLVLDLGNMHSAADGEFDTDTMSGLVEGEEYSFNFFFAERHTYQSHIRITTNLLTNQHIKDVTIQANPDTSNILEGDTISLSGLAMYDSSWVDINGDTTTISLIDSLESQNIKWTLLSNSSFDSSKSLISADSGMNVIFTSSEPNKDFSIIATYRDNTTFISFSDTLNISVGGNNPPIANADTIICNEGEQVSILYNGNTSVLDNDIDNTIGTELSAALITGPIHGSLNLNSNGTFSYTHFGSEIFIDSFSYVVNDGPQGSDTATAIIEINPVNDHAPIARDDSLWVVQIGGTSTNTVMGQNSLLANDSTTDLPFETLSASLVAPPSHGTAVVNSDGTFRYTHDGSTNIVDSFTYIATDGLYNDTAKVSIEINVTFHKKPIANNDVIKVFEGGLATTLLSGDSSVLSNDSPNNLLDTLTASLLSTPNFGTLTFGSDGTFRYIHDGFENFNDSFSYVITNLGNYSDTGMVSIVINPVNDNKPIAADDIINVNDIGGTSSATASGASSLLWNDYDIDFPNGTLSATTLIPPQHGVFNLNPDGTFTYTHDGSNNLSDSLLYILSDGLHYDTAAVHIGISISFDDKPVATNDSIRVNEGAVSTILESGMTSILDNDKVANSLDKLTSSILIASHHGSLSLNTDGTFSYTHDGSENFNDNFTYVITNLGGLKDTARVFIFINPINDNTPHANNHLIRVPSLGTSVDSTIYGYKTLLANSNDTDLPFDTLSVSLVDNAKYGTFILNADGSFIYTHDGTDNRLDTIGYQISDNAGHTSMAHAYIHINSNPIAIRDSIATSEGYETNILTTGLRSLIRNDLANDMFTDSLKAALVEGPVHGTAEVNPDGTFRYINDDSEHSRDSFSYEITDLAGQKDTGIVAIKIYLVNDNAPIAYPDTIAVEQGLTTVMLKNGSHSIVDNDTDIDFNDSITCELYEDVSHGFLTLKTNGRFHYIHDGTNNLFDQFTYIAIDSGGLTDTGIVTIIIDPKTDIDYISPVNGSKQKVSFHVTPNIANPGDDMSFVIKGKHEPLIVEVTVLTYMGTKLFKKEFTIPSNVSSEDQIFGKWNGILENGKIPSKQDLVMLFKLYSTDKSLLGIEKVYSAIKAYK